MIRFMSSYLIIFSINLLILYNSISRVNIEPSNVAKDFSYWQQKQQEDRMIFQPWTHSEICDASTQQQTDNGEASRAMPLRAKSLTTGHLPLTL